MAITYINTVFHENPTNHERVRYTITVNGTPLTYTPNGVNSVDKTFQDEIIINNHGIVGTDPESFAYNPSLGFVQRVFVGEPLWADYQSDGKVIVVGNISEYDGQVINRICRLNTDGTLDTTFTPPSLSSTPTKVRVDLLNNIFICGNFQLTEGVTTYKYFVKLLPTGVVDTTFLPITFNLPPSDFLFHSSGQLYIVGNFTTVNGVQRRGITRHNGSTGAILTFSTTGFRNGSTLSSFNVRCVVEQSAGNIIVGGLFTHYNNQPAQGIVRIVHGAAGAHDATFTSSNGFYNINGNIANVYTIHIDSSFFVNQVVCGGSFEGYAGNPSKNLVRLTINGAYDIVRNC